MLLSVCTWPKGLCMLKLNCVLDHLSTTPTPYWHCYCGEHNQAIWQLQLCHTAVGQVKWESIWTFTDTLTLFFFFILNTATCNFQCAKPWTQTFPVCTFISICMIHQVSLIFFPFDVVSTFFLSSILSCTAAQKEVAWAVKLPGSLFTAVQQQLWSRDVEHGCCWAKSGISIFLCIYPPCLTVSKQNQFHLGEK